MSRLSLKGLQAAAGASAGEAVYVDDVFSTYLYDGANGSTTNEAVTVSNGIDLYNEGGLIWFKRRDVANGHALFDSQRDSFASYLRTEGTNTQSTLSGHVTANSNGNGFTLSSTGYGITNNTSPATYASWTFRKQAKFFDIVTWTGDDVQGRSISHNLGQVPGCIIVKITSGTSDNWVVYHRSTGAGKFLKLNATDAQLTSNAVFPTTPTDSVFYVGNDSAVNWSGGTYVAYLFAHDAQDFGTNSDESIIKCGSFTGPTATVNLGFEPQWLLIKPSNTTANWAIYDVMRGQVVGGAAQELYPNLSNAEGSGGLFGTVNPEPTGFSVTGGYSASHIYVAIRRPHKPAEEFAATDLFAIDTRNSTGDGKEPGFRSGFPVDMNIFRTNIIQSNAARVSGRLTGNKYLETSSTNAELTGSTTEFDYMNGWLSSGGTSAEAYSWMFRRAPEFFDVVAYTGDGTSSHAISHNLGVTPELMIVKRRNASASWYVWESSFAGTNDFIFLNFSNAKTSASTVFPSDPTSSAFTVGSSAGINNSGDTFIAYLFATAAGISKVGSYSGTGSNVDVNCGFTSGARFVLVKRTDSTGDWYVWDSARGIVAGNDPYLLLNSTAAEVTSTDYIDPLSSGFTITSTAPAALNASGGTYIFLAIA